ncbi:MAG: hypothetical protein RL320_895 [Pseudomonadota bacterium]
MKDLANPMATEFTDHREPVTFRMPLNGMANIAQCLPWSNLLNALPHTFVSHLNQALGRHGRAADHEHPTGVAVIAILNDRDVDVEDVAVLEQLGPWNPMAYLVVH